jgi:hypothetical protein
MLRQIDRSRRPSQATVIAWLSLFVALGGSAVAVGGAADTDRQAVNDEGEIQACFDKKGKGLGEVRLLIKGRCTRGEQAITWNQEGPQGAQGQQGQPGTPGAAGSPDTPQQVLEKLAQVDGSGSGLDADLLDGISSSAFALRSDVFTKSESDARFVRSAPREVLVRAEGDAAAAGQALRQTLNGLPAASAADPIVVRLTGGAYAVSDTPLNVPAFVTLRGAGRRATEISKNQEPVVLAQGSALEDLSVTGFSAFGPAAVQVAGTDAYVESVDLSRSHNFTAEALRVNAGASVTVRDADLTADGFGTIVDVQGVRVSGTATLIDTRVTATDGAGLMHGVAVESGGALTMLGGVIDVDDTAVQGSTPVGLRLAGSSALVLGTRIDVGSSVQAVNGVNATTGGSSLSGVSVTASSANSDVALAASNDITVESTQLEATGAGDTGVSTTGAGTEVRVGASRIDAPTTASGGGSETCVFTYSGAFAALGANCL